MASFTTTNASSSPVGRELSIASTFVKQYYTLLNKAPCFIYNFYSHDSTFIHGTIEMANEHYTEPTVGREKIKRKMEELKLNDCRAKIKQIDCLETLAGGLVIQVIGELSNNGKPMRRFLQTFVLAPSPDEPRVQQDGDSQQQQSYSRPVPGADSRRGVNVNENSSSSNNQKFYVLNSIFRYQDDGTDGDYEDDATSTHANSFVDSANGAAETEKIEPLSKVAPGGANSNGGPIDYSQSSRRRPVETIRAAEDIARLANDLEEGAKLSQSTPDADHKRDAAGPKVVSNGTGGADKKNETSEKSSENGRVAGEGPQPHALNTSGSASSATTGQPAPVPVVVRPQPPNEPKTWANMVRNANPQSAQVQTSVNKPTTVEQQQNQITNQPTPAQAHSQPQQPHQQPQMQQSRQPQQIALQSQQQQQQQQLHQQQRLQDNSQRRRHMPRKPTSKPVGRSIKNNRPRLPTVKPTE